MAFKAMTPFDQLIKLPCGRCTGCRLEKSRQWAIRLMHEAQLHDRTSFITLTYDDQHLPTRGTSSQSLTVPRASRLRTTTRNERDTHAKRTHGTLGPTASLEPRDLKIFLKKLSRVTRKTFGKGVRYYACGEYGERGHRPHYHIALFGEDFRGDRAFYKRSKTGHDLFKSKTLTSLWGKGSADIGELTFESAAYVARYVMKKINGKMADEHYRRTDEAGNDYWIEPEFARMSRMPGLGKPWWDKYKEQVIAHDHVIVRGKPSKPPRYYDELVRQLSQDAYANIKLNREAKLNKESSTPERLRAGEAILAAAQSQRKRPLE